VATLAFPLPANIVFSLMGVPEHDYAQVKQWCGYRAALSWGRPAPQDQVEIAGARQPAGAKLFLWLAAAGRDAAAFDQPDQFDLHRVNAAEHLAFGKGLHYCLGANLGKLEAQIAISELARRYPQLQLVPGQQLTFHPNISFRGPQSLRVRTNDR
jgi:cytochrome P450